MLVNERIDLSRELALRLEAAFGPATEMLPGMQTDHSLARGLMDAPAGVGGRPAQGTKRTGQDLLRLVSAA